MSREGKTDLGLGIRELTYFLTYTLIVFSYWGFMNGKDFAWQLSLTLGWSRHERVDNINCY